MDNLDDVELTPFYNFLDFTTSDIDTGDIYQTPTYDAQGNVIGTTSDNVQIGMPDTPTEWSKLLTSLGSVLKGTSSLGSAGSIGGLLGIAALANKMFGSSGSGGYAGYQGGIPTYTAARTMNTIPTTVANPLAGQTGQPATIPRRPGSGGVTYFSPMTYTEKKAEGGIASLGHLGSYSDGGQLLRGPGDGVSDDIPATIADKQPARLANNEFVIPARIVSEIGNGSTEAGAKKLYDMMRRVQSRRAKTIGKDKVAVDSKAYKELEKL